MTAGPARAVETVLPLDDKDTRRAQVRAIFRSFVSFRGLASTNDAEDAYLLSGVVQCYISGADVGAVFVAHAVCERELAAVLHHSGSAPSDSTRWGLGPLIKHFGDAEMVPTDLIDDLTALNDHRKALYHFGHSESSTALRARTLELIDEIGTMALLDEFRRRTGTDGDLKDIHQFAMDQALRDMALHALTAATRLRTHVARD